MTFYTELINPKVVLRFEVMQRTLLSSIDSRRYKYLILCKFEPIAQSNVFSLNYKNYYSILKINLHKIN